MITVEEALAKVLGLCRPVELESVALRAAAGRVLAAPAIARMTQPPFAASAMDGYAIRAEDHRPNARLRVVGEAAAGHGHGGTVRPGEAVRIFTGAPLPEGAAQVVLQENVQRSEDWLQLSDRLESQTHIRPLGQDFRQGDRIEAPLRLQAKHLGLLASMNLAEVSVARRPDVAIIATGDELVMPGEAPGPDQIICSNSFALAAMAEQAGATARVLPIARDNEASLRQVFSLAAGADLIVTSGGASVGDHDLVGKVATDMGLERAFYKIAMRPGKPLMAGRLGGAALLGLPGNPVSAIVCAHLFMMPLLAAMQGLEGAPRLLSAVLAEDVGPTGPRTHYMRARLLPGPDMPRIAPFASQDSALLRILSDSDALLVRPMGDGPRRAGEIVGYLPI
jgi:molybdopterin molybdotransferase